MLTGSGSARVMVHSRQGREWQEFGEIFFCCEVPPASQPAIARADCIILHTNERQSKRVSDAAPCALLATIAALQSNALACGSASRTGAGSGDLACGQSEPNQEAEA